MSIKIKNGIKKGIATEALVIAILMLVSFIVLLLMFNKTKTTVEQSEWLTTCKRSVEVMSGVVSLTKAHYTSELKCPTKFFEVNHKGIFRDGKLIAPFKRGDEDKIKDVLKREVANDLIECWSAFHKGRLELFKEDGIFCVVCSQWHFSDDIDVKVNGLSDYLRDHYVPGTNLDYYTYLFGYKTKGSDVLNKDTQELINKEFFIDTSRTRDYSVTFTYIKGKDKMQNFLVKTKNAALSGGVLIGVGIVSIYFGPFAPVVWAGYALVAAGITLAGIVAEYSRGEPQWIAFVSFRDTGINSLANFSCEMIPVKTNYLNPNDYLDPNNLYHNNQKNQT